MYKPGSILKPVSSGESLYLTPEYGFASSNTGNGDWYKIPETTVVMVLGTPPLAYSVTDDSYYYELLVGDKHAQHHRGSIENKARWKEITDE